MVPGVIKFVAAFLLMLAMLAFGGTAAADSMSKPRETPGCPFGVCMVDPLKPNSGWAPDGFGEESREYKGQLDFDHIDLFGTREREGFRLSRRVAYSEKESANE